METFLFILILFVLGVLALYLKQIRKNFMVLVFFITTGYGVWHYASPYIMVEDKGLEESLIIQNQRYVDHVINDLEHAMDDEDFKQTIERSLDGLDELDFPNEKSESEQPQESEHASAPNPFAPLERIVIKLIELLNSKGILINEVSE
ncbi:hypothetical protein KJ652_00160 [Patescibacteria group bacterium]|nr:hypothetical protein [Patescibacteria group bacterium]MBU1122986.1 hypothetical protein [Patescibacteria group bacterium]MBU1911674.1 hypothetical protein [Patescibacteria group bacterium]